MIDRLQNPVYNALLTGDAHFNSGNDKVKYFDEQVSPFAGFDEKYENGFEDLHKALPHNRKILYAIPNEIEIPNGWKLLRFIPGLQFVLDKYVTEEKTPVEIIPLTTVHVAEMIELTALTRPGPFDQRTIEFGSYFGIFQNGRLAAMAGQRLHVSHYTEISAVCTHPDFLGKGFAGALLHLQIDIILKENKIPFLHVRNDNRRAIQLYERLGFKVSRPMNFYVLEKA